MPELPEVEMFRRALEEGATGRKIHQLKVYDAKVLRCPESQLVEGLVGHFFLPSQRIGKYLFVPLSSGQVLVIHFGLTGSLAFFEEAEDPPRFTRVAFLMESGSHLAYVCPRKFGRLDIGPDVQSLQKARQLAEDAATISWEDFLHHLGQTRRMVKTVLLDQSVAAGVGNWIADEILFQAKIYPERRVADLSEEERKRMFDRMKEIIQTALAVEGDYEALPAHFLIHRRGWTEVSPAFCENCTGETDYIKVGGRATYFCAICQKKPD
ncbi:MAG: bifunctional DNA-formamidopyrimidine glycosylase/DNA-(apurinic or apyrimidinic site) lyase [Microscillaceae bacterium]